MKINATHSAIALLVFIVLVRLWVVVYEPQSGFVAPLVVLILVVAYFISRASIAEIRAITCSSRIQELIGSMKVPDEIYPANVRRADSFHLEVFHKVAQLTEIAKPLSPENQISTAKHLRTYQEFKPHPKLEQYFHKLIKTLSESDLTPEAKSELRETLRFQLPEPFKAQIQSLLEDRSRTNLPK